MLAIKAGGSIITRKGRSPAFDRAGAARLASALARLEEPFLLVHGTGSYGKPPAVRYGYLSGRLSPGQAPVAAIKASLLQLHAAFLRELLRRGLRAVSCPGCAYFSVSSGRPRLERRKDFLGWLRRGFVPVINSDIFAVPGGFRVVSSDALLAEASAAAGADLAVFLTRAPGFIGEDGLVKGEVPAKDIPRLSRFLRPAGKDVSGGMKGKLSEISRIVRRGAGAAVLDGRRPGLLLELRSGKAGGTYFHA